MPLHPAPGIHFALIDRDLVILDLGADAYLCIADALPDGSATQSADTKRHGGLTTDAEALLSESGYLVSRTLKSQAVDPVAAPPARPRRDLRDLPASRPGLRDVATALVALTDVARIGSDPSVADLLHLRRTGKPLADDPVRAAVVSGAFAEILPWLPFEGACLRRSALLVAVLRRHGLAAVWVFGVRTWPFRAHCWVQIDDLCLNDDVERLAAYTPILAV